MLPVSVKEVCNLTDDNLWGAYEACAKRSSPAALNGNVVFPVSSAPGSRIRVSEQEARFSFVEMLKVKSLFYHVEVPTSQRYSFTRHPKTNTQRSGHIDLAVLDDTGARICNVEFKSIGISRRAQNRDHFSKDFRKLLSEDHWGLWFNLLESVDNSTINNTIAAMQVEVDAIYSEQPNVVKSPGLSLHVCVLKHGFSLHWDPGAGNPAISAIVPRVEMDVSRPCIKSVTCLNGWVMRQRP